MFCQETFVVFVCFFFKKEKLQAKKEPAAPAESGFSFLSGDANNDGGEETGFSFISEEPGTGDTVNISIKLLAESEGCVLKDEDRCDPNPSKFHKIFLIYAD